MDHPDLIISLGPACRTAWNIRRFFGTDRAYPFDWWFTPTLSLLALLDRDLTFSVGPEDLTIAPPEDGFNFVYNRRHNIGHHHDFDRGPSGQVEALDEAAIARVNRKYQFLFNRFWQDIDRAARPLVVLEEIHEGWPDRAPDGLPAPPGLNGWPTPPAVIEGLRDRLGPKVRVLIAPVASRRSLDFPGGALIARPDTGARLGLPPHLDWVEPVHVYEANFAEAGLRRDGLAQAEDPAALPLIEIATDRPWA